MKRIVSVALVFAMASTARAAEELVTAAEVDSYCNALDQRAARDEMPVRIFADVATGIRDVPSDWREFETDGAREERDTGENLNENAHVWSKEGKTVFVHFLYQSPSRDWAHEVDYCFRPGGSLARVSSELRTFHGKVRVVRNAAYGPTRAALSRREHVFDLESGQPRHDREFMDHAAPIFWSVSELPFSGLLASSIPQK